jgi:hypothetical protein
MNLRRLIGLLFIGTTLSCWTHVSSAEDTEVSFPRLIPKPFYTDLARKHFAQCFPEVTEADLKRLANIEYYGYLEFPPATACTTPGCRPEVKIFTSTRVMGFNATQLNPSAMKAAVFSLEGGDCSYNRIFSFSSSVEQNVITYRYTPYHKERSCNYGVVIDKGTASADVVTAVTLLEDFSIVPHTTKSNIKTTNNFSFGNAFADALFGDLILGPVGAFVATVEIQEINKTIVSGIGAQNAEVNFGITGVDLHPYSKVQQRLDTLGASRPVGPYITKRDASGFVVKDENVVVEVQQVAQVYDLYRADFIDARRFELDFLQYLNETEGKTYTVKEKDSLWSIVRREYLDPRLYILVAQTNKVKKNQRLKIGTKLTLPRWQEMCKMLGGNPNLVLTGQSLWSKAQKGDIPKDPMRVRTYSGNRSLIYPLEVLEVRGANDR